MRGQRVTWFSNFPGWAARLILVVMAALVISGGVLTTPRAHVPDEPADLMLYRAVVERVVRGENYYDAAAAEQRARGYPTAPAPVFREPTLAWTLAALRTDGLRRAAVIGLSLITLIALIEALARSIADSKRRVLAGLLIGSGMSMAWFSVSPYFHEVWAALLIALSLASYRLSHWSVSVVLGLLACLFRELALPFLGAMAASALYERRYREFAGWIAGIAVFCALFAWHLSVAATLHQPGDLMSRGWLGFGGWLFIIETAKVNSMLLLAPKFVIALMVCLAIVGFAGTRDPWLLRAALIVCGYLASFSIVGRPDNFYWGLLIAPLLPIGVALSPMAFRDLIARASTGAVPLHWRNRTAPVPSTGIQTRHSPVSDAV
jgi:hypothetical protein